MKRIVLGILVLCLLVTAVAGCGSKEETSGGDTVMEIKWLPQCDSPINEDSPVIAALEEKFGVKFNFVYLDRTKQTELLNVRIASLDIPDVFRVQESTSFNTYSTQGVLSEIPDDLLQSKGKAIYDTVVANGGERVWKTGEVGGKQYGIPLLNMQGTYPLVPIWRDDWLAKVGIEKIPETIEEAEAAFVKFTNEDPDGNGQKDTYGLSNLGFYAVYGAYGTQEQIWQEKDGKLEYSSASDEMREALTTLNRWYQMGLIDPEFISGENKGQAWSNAVSFWNGKIGFSVPGMYYNVAPPTDMMQPSVNYTNFKKLQGDNATYKEAAPFKGPDGKSGTLKWGTFSTSYMVFGRDLANDMEKFGKILEINNELVSNFDSYLLAVRGIEGEHYKVENDTYITLMDSVQDPNISAKLGLSANGIGYVASNNFDFLKRSTTDKFAYADEVASFYGYENKMWGNLPSAAQYMPGLDSKIKEATTLFITGEKPLSEWDAYVADLYASGLEQLTKEANEWYAQ